MFNNNLVLVMAVVQILIGVLLFFLLPVGGAEAAEDRLVAATSKGLLLGSRGVSFSGDNHFTQFVGVPFAAPPVGKRRFARPDTELLKPWDGVKDATAPASPCLQPSSGEDVENTEGVIGQEDCLYLNVYRPDACLNKGDCPVLVWLHPGGFERFDSSPETFGPHVWMDREVVLVTLNYRLGVMGFLSLGTEAVPGNLGLWDQQAALLWVKNEISSFSGDPTRVTLYGSGSAGGKSALLHLASPANRGKGLFHRVVAHSGSPVHDRILRPSKSGRPLALEVSEAVGCKQEEGDEDDKALLHCLRLASPRSLLLSSKSLSSRLPFQPFVPTASEEDEFMPERPEDVFREGKFDKMPVMIGSNLNDGLKYAGHYIAHPSSFSNFTRRLPQLLFNKAAEDVAQTDTQLAELIKKYMGYRSSF